LAEGNGSFSNLHLAGLVLGVPFILKKILPIISRGGLKTYIFLVVVTGVPIAVAYWTYMSQRPDRKNFKVTLPGRPIEHYIVIKDPELKEKYNGKKKIPMQIFYDAYFEGKIDFNPELHGGEWCERCCAMTRP
jgi:sphingolipid C9-methyltransferase